MAEKDLQKQIDEINIKLDAILECATAQKLRSARLDDLMHDLGPVANEVIIDMIRKMHEFEQKGYFEFFTEITRAMDNIITHYSGEDVKLLADNIVTIMDTLKNITQPEMLQSMNNAVNVFQKLELDDIPEYSIWQAMKEMRSPEMKKGIGFMISFLKNLSNENVVSIKQ